MALPKGTQLGPYEILAPLGAGGMGEVYRARDSKLNRDVALKVLRAEVAQDPERLARFRRESQFLASLNHPNIAAIYGLEEGALVMELVEGDEPKGPLPVAEVLPLARQLAEALEYAHEKGIVHRDLKPANLKVTPEGKLKVLDFGLAKAMDETASVNMELSPTLSVAATRGGVILGTASYMSPEQARGKAVDKRADIWAFGCVLYELLTGARVFPGETVTDAVAALVARDPDWRALPQETPAAIRRLLARCLDKDHKSRLRDIGEARVLFEQPIAPPEQTSPVAAAAVAQPHPSIAVWALGAATVLSLAVAAKQTWFRPQPPEASPVHFSLSLPPGTLRSGQDAAPQAVPSPNGRYLAFIAADEKTRKTYLWVRPLDSLVGNVWTRRRGRTFLAGRPTASSSAISPTTSWRGWRSREAHR